MKPLPAWEREAVPRLKPALTTGSKPSKMKGSKLAGSPELVAAIT
jgi:hypothetical protein